MMTRAFACYNKNKDIRKAGSSGGGILSAGGGNHS